MRDSLKDRANDVRHLIREQAPQDLPDFAISFGICCVDDSSSADWLETNLC